jgi:hypothetical protein
MHTYSNLTELAQACAKQARITLAKDASAVLWKMALDYQREAAASDGGNLPEIGPPPTWFKE